MWPRTRACTPPYAPWRQLQRDFPTLPCHVGVFEVLAGLTQYYVQRFIIMTRVVVEQNKPSHFAVARHVDRFQPGTMAPTFLGDILFRCVLRVINQHIGVLGVLA